jgi:hypothetical protein
MAIGTMNSECGHVDYSISIRVLSGVRPMIERIRSNADEACARMMSGDTQFYAVLTT